MRVLFKAIAIFAVAFLGHKPAHAADQQATCESQAQTFEGSLVFQFQGQSIAFTRIKDGSTLCKRTSDSPLAQATWNGGTLGASLCPAVFSGLQGLVAKYSTDLNSRCGEIKQLMEGACKTLSGGDTFEACIAKNDRNAQAREQALLTQLEEIHQKSNALKTALENAKTKSADFAQRLYGVLNEAFAKGQGGAPLKTVSGYPMANNVKASEVGPVQTLGQAWAKLASPLEFDAFVQRATLSKTANPLASLPFFQEIELARAVAEKCQQLSAADIPHRKQALANLRDQGGSAAQRDCMMKTGKPCPGSTITGHEDPNNRPGNPAQRPPGEQLANNSPKGTGAPDSRGGQAGGMPDMNGISQAIKGVADAVAAGKGGPSGQSGRLPSQANNGALGGQYPQRVAAAATTAVVKPKADSYALSSLGANGGLEGGGNAVVAALKTEAAAAGDQGSGQILGSASTGNASLNQTTGTSSAPPAERSTGLAATPAIGTVGGSAASAGAGGGSAGNCKGPECKNPKGGAAGPNGDILAANGGVVTNHLGTGGAGNSSFDSGNSGSFGGGNSKLDFAPLPALAPLPPLASLGGVTGAGAGPNPGSFAPLENSFGDAGPKPFKVTEADLPPSTGVPGFTEENPNIGLIGAGRSAGPKLSLDILTDERSLFLRVHGTHERFQRKMENGHTASAK